jgi:hypothetical protein
MTVSPSAGISSVLPARGAEARWNVRLLGWSGDGTRLFLTADLVFYHMQWDVSSVTCFMQQF